MEPAIIVHGGAYNILDQHVDKNIEGVCRAAGLGFNKLANHGSCVEAVVAAITYLEDDVTFDAGHGSVLNADGEVEMDCMLMRGSDLKMTNVMGAKTVCNPIQLAERMLHNEASKTTLIGDEADSTARELNLPTTTADDLITEEARSEWIRLTKFKNTIDDVFRGRTSDEANNSHDTVGCVAIDCHGNIACGTSTGGITAKLKGRVGDSPLVGAGGYCNDTIGGVSTTGHGEAITKICLAYEVIKNMEKGMSPDEAIGQALTLMDGCVEGGHGGAIAIDRHGNVGMHFNTPRMIWASMRDGVLMKGIDSGDHLYTTKLPSPISPVSTPKTLSPSPHRVVFFLESQSDSVLGLLDDQTVVSCLKEAAASKGGSLESALNMIEYVENTLLIAEGEYNSTVCVGLHGSSVSSVNGLSSPARLANDVRTKTKHTLMVGEGAERLSDKVEYNSNTTSVKVEYNSKHQDVASDKDSAWLAGVLVCSKEEAPVCIVTESAGGNSNHCNSIGCRVYSLPDVGCCVALGDRSALCRFVLSKMVCSQMFEGVSVDDSVDQTLRHCTDRHPGADITLIAADCQGKFSKQSTTNLTCIRYIELL